MMRVGLDDLLGLLGDLHHLGAGPLQLAEVGVAHLDVLLEAAGDGVEREDRGVPVLARQ